MNVTNMSNRELCRLYRIIIKRIEYLLRGGLTWGWDMPTLGILYPDLHDAVVTIRAEGRRRGL
jgi:hypothetical protein